MIPFTEETIGRIPIGFLLGNIVVKFCEGLVVYRIVSFASALVGSFLSYLEICLFPVLFLL